MTLLIVFVEQRLLKNKNLQLVLVQLVHKNINLIGKDPLQLYIL